MEEEGDGPRNGEAHPDSDESDHLRVRSAPFLGEETGEAFLGSSGVLGSEAVHRVDERGEVATPFKAGGFVFPLLLRGGALEDLGGFGVAVGPGIRVTQTDVENGPTGALPKSVGEDVATRLIAEVVDALGGVLAPLASCHAAAIEYGGLDGDARAGEREGAEVGPFVANVIVADGDQVTFLAVEPVLNCEALAAAVAAVGEGEGEPAISDGHVVVPLGFREFGTAKAVRDGGEPGAGGGLSLHPLFDLGDGPGEEGGPEGLITLLPRTAVGGAGIADAAAVVVKAKGLVGEEGVDKGLCGCPGAAEECV